MVSLRGLFEAATHDISIFVEAKRKFEKNNGIEMPFIPRLKRVNKLLEIVDISVNQVG